MEIKYHLSRAEYQHMVMRNFDRHPSYRKRRMFAQVYVATLLFILVWLSAESIPPALLASLMGFAVTLPLIRLLSRRNIGVAYDLRANRDDVNVRIDELSLYLSKKHLRSEIDWEAVTVLEEDNVGFYLKYGPLDSIFVPRRVFANAEEAQRFWVLAQSYSQHAGPVAQKAAVGV